MDEAALKGLNRRRLQGLAKTHHVKANATSESIIKTLLAMYPEGVPKKVPTVGAQRKKSKQQDDAVEPLSTAQKQASEPQQVEQVVEQPDEQDMRAGPSGATTAVYPLALQSRAMSLVETQDAKLDDNVPEALSQNLGMPEEPEAQYEQENETHGLIKRESMSELHLDEYQSPAGGGLPGDDAIEDEEEERDLPTLSDDDERGAFHPAEAVVNITPTPSPERRANVSVRHLEVTHSDNNFEVPAPSASERRPLRRARAPSPSPMLSQWEAEHSDDNPFQTSRTPPSSARAPPAVSHSPATAGYSTRGASRQLFAPSGSTRIAPVPLLRPAVFDNNPFQDPLLKARPPVFTLPQPVAGPSRHQQNVFPPRMFFRPGEQPLAPLPAPAFTPAAVPLNVAPPSAPSTNKGKAASNQKGGAPQKKEIPELRNSNDPRDDDHHPSTEKDMLDFVQKMQCVKRENDIHMRSIITMKKLAKEYRSQIESLKCKIQVEHASQQRLQSYFVGFNPNLGRDWTLEDLYEGKINVELSTDFNGEIAGEVELTVQDNARLHLREQQGLPDDKRIVRNVSAYEFYEVEKPAVPSKPSRLRTPPKRPHDYEIDYAEDTGGMYREGPGERRGLRHRMFHKEEAELDEDGRYYPRDRIDPPPAKRMRLIGNEVRTDSGNARAGSSTEHQVNNFARGGFFMDTSYDTEEFEDEDEEMVEVENSETDADEVDAILSAPIPA
ncbi:hypothetical protein C8Q75DRAFT_811297 [Abortiporus biennis]|nr:hypothetical protein C8Q75DRAFT_811297 [Abortiporus biennis]